MAQQLTDHVEVAPAQRRSATGRPTAVPQSQGVWIQSACSRGLDLHLWSTQPTDNSCVRGTHTLFGHEECATNCATFLAQHVQHVLYVQVLLDLAKLQKSEQVLFVPQIDQNLLGRFGILIIHFDINIHIRRLRA